MSQAAWPRLDHGTYRNERRDCRRGKDVAAYAQRRRRRRVIKVFVSLPRRVRNTTNTHAFQGFDVTSVQVHPLHHARHMHFTFINSFHEQNYVL